MNDTNRRVFLTAAAALPAAASTAPGNFLAFSDRAHISTRPEVKDKLVWCFTTVLGCPPPTVLKVPSMSEPVLAFAFPDGGSLSVEFTSDALDEEHARRGAWLEIRSEDPRAVQQKILAAGLNQVHHPATNTFYFEIPGGQVIGVVPAKNPAAGELRR